MTVTNLGNTDFDVVLDSFLLAFQNYFVTVPTDRDYYRERWKAAMVDFNYSYGMFDGDTLVGFVIHAIDHRGGRLTAFNTGTGVIPEYRGQKIVKSIYRYALDDLKRIGVTNCALEVITKNERAIRSYKGIWFETFKKYKCFKGTLSPKTVETVPLKEVDLGDVDWARLPDQDSYSWDNQKESILKSNYKFFQVLGHTSPESYFIVQPNTGYLVQFGVFDQKSNVWDRLFCGIRQISSSVKINNVDERQTARLDHLRAMGLANTVDQYEMRMEI